MTKRKVQFQEPEEEEEAISSKKAKLKEAGSDSEDEATKTPDADDVLDEDDIEGQEDETFRNVDGIALTPFNLKDELQEGHFDGQGNYIRNTEDENVTDGWLDSVDWSKVTDKQPESAEPMNEEVAAVNVLQVKYDMLSLLKPGETVLKAIRRLGGNKKAQSSADRWKKKKAKAAEPVMTQKEQTDKANMLKLTGYADDLLQNGDFQIYEKTYEQLSFETREKAKKRTPVKSQFDDAVEPGDNDDDDDDELENAFKSTKTDDTKTTTTSDNNSKTSDPLPSSDKVLWQYKLEDNEESKIVGTFTSEQMLMLQEAGKFKKPVFCRCVDKQGPFYSSSRVDFELYM